MATCVLRLGNESEELKRRNDSLHGLQPVNGSRKDVRCYSRPIDIQPGVRLCLTDPTPRDSGATKQVGDVFFLLAVCMHRTDRKSVV